MTPDDLQTEGFVTNIQRFTVHDGPGIRTEVFLKGCPLHCRWCSNPESLKPYPEVGVYRARCIGVDKCGLCFEACPGGADYFTIEQGLVTAIDRAMCTRCLACSEVCPSNALVTWGKKYTAADVVETVLADIDFYRRSGGGITLSGGDPLVQWQFSLAVLKECRSRDIHTCLETEHHVNPAVLDRIYPYTDLVITDIKHMDPEKHREYTGVDNKLILNNIIATAKENIPLIIRIPIIFGLNDNDENIKVTADFIGNELGNSVIQIQLLPYRRLGVEKYCSLGIPYGLEGYQPPERKVWENKIITLAAGLKAYGLPAVAGSTNKI
jgi:pyruvate formate lyase activating enzyme